MTYFRGDFVSQFEVPTINTKLSMCIQVSYQSNHEPQDKTGNRPFFSETLLTEKVDTPSKRGHHNQEDPSDA